MYVYVCMQGTQIGVLHGALGLGPTDSPSLSIEEFLVFLYRPF